MQIELENEFNVISDYAELTQAFKIPPGVARNQAKQHQPQQHQQHVGYAQGAVPVHPRSTPQLGDDPTNSPRWEIRTPESKRQPQQHQQPAVLCLTISGCSS